MKSHKETGDKGEEIAVAYLFRQGYKILARNWYYGHNELDIVARQGDELVIVEVKSRTSDRYEHPSESVSKQKIRHIIEAAEAYILENEIDLETRFDVISVIFYGKEYQLEHFKDAFFPTM